MGEVKHKGWDYIEKVNTVEQASKVINEVSSIVRVSVGFLRTVYQLYEEDRHYKGKKVNRQA